jgi:hypothetical protein
MFMSEATTQVVVIRTVGQAELLEDVIFHTREALTIGDLVDLKVTKPSDAPVYGQARVTGYESFIRPGRLNRYKAVRIQ